MTESNRRDRPRSAEDYNVIRTDYLFNASPFSEDDTRAARLKWVIQNKLSQVEQTYIILYADCQSLRKLARRLSLSHSLLAKEINKIKAHILDEYNKITDNEHLY